MENNKEAFRCSSCGARLIANSIVNVRCAYCGSVHFIKEKITEEYLPDAIIQFKNSSDKIPDLLFSYIKKSKELNQKVKNNYKIMSITPIYVPCVIYDYGLELYKKYEYSESNGEKTRFYDKETKKDEIYRVVQDCSINVSDDYMFSIEPFDLSNMQNFNPIYLSGAYTEVSNDKNINEKAINKIKKSIINNNKFIKGVLDCKISTIDKLKIYLPIWLVKVKVEDKIYSFVMNDTTNKWATNAKVSVTTDMLCLLLSILIYGIIISLASDIAFKIFLTLACVTLSINLYSDIKKHKYRSAPLKTVEEYDIYPISKRLIYEKNVNPKEVVGSKIFRFSLDGKEI